MIKMRFGIKVDLQRISPKSRSVQEWSLHFRNNRVSGSNRQISKCARIVLAGWIGMNRMLSNYVQYLILCGDERGSIEDGSDVNAVRQFSRGA